MPKKEKSDYWWHKYDIDLQADKKGFIKCNGCGKKIKKQLSHYCCPNCYCDQCWKPIHKQSMQEIDRGLRSIGL